jgi:nicotinate-nucleotide pyrophosphorylase (carboxylating)
MYATTMLERLIDLWLDEDVGHGDLTAQLMVDAGAEARFDVNARERMVVAGIDVLARVFRRCDPRIEVQVLRPDGTRVQSGETLARVSGPAQGILTGERTALNIVQRLSGIATETARYVAEMGDTRARLVDTRKTTPGLRMLEKHAVVCGGAANHRLGLDGGVMLKDNHIAVCGGIGPAVARARAAVPILTRIEVECDRLEQVHEALAAGADVIMLDNMTLDAMREAVAIVAGRVPLEASGGVRFERLRAIAETGVDFISCGRLTQGSPAVDIGLDEPR